ncbi:Protein of unknown function (DUF793) [Abeliophyllum distichum]|uniref:Uncharacterized protein n=1 Tax=Abeliophyllum distichum TaxID=126358 RepID=A0ABD1THA2_9LAMI
MPSSDNQSSSMSFASYRRPILGIRNDQIHSMGANHDSNAQELDSFQRHVFAQFKDLSAVSPDELLSITWVQKLLDAFTSCQEEFKVILSNNKDQLLKPPADRLVSEFFDRAIKALDICNASRDGIEKIRLWQKHLDIIICALDARQRMIGEASKQLQSIANNLALPRGNELAATNGLAMLVYTMSFVLMFILWVLVAVIPCQDRSIQIPFAIPRQFSWSAPFFLLHGRIMDESKKREHRNSSGLLKEICQIEKCVHQITDLVDSAQFPLTEEQKEDVKECVRELSLVCEVCKSGLDPLERQLREVFRKIMSCRLEFLGKTTQP